MGGRSRRPSLHRPALQRGTGRLRPGGRLLLTHSSVCGESATITALERAGLATDVIVRHEGPLGPLLADRAEDLRTQDT